MSNLSLSRYAYIAIIAAILTIGLKSTAFWVTGSVGILSESLESGINLLTAIMALFTLQLIQKPPDGNHLYGHSKAEYFSSVIEGILIIAAAIGIAFTSIFRIIHPHPIDLPLLGIGISSIASLINLLTGIYLFKAGKKFHSITLEADAHHLFTDVWTAIGVIVGIALVAITHINLFDPLVALVVAVNISYTGYKLIERSLHGFMDTAIDLAEQKEIKEIIKKNLDDTMKFHALRTRQSGMRKFMSVHILVPKTWTVQKGHDLIETIEKEIHQRITNITVFTHLEPVEDPKSFEDTSITRTF